MYTSSLSDFSEKNIAELFLCHRKLAKIIADDIKAIPKDNVAYKKEMLPDGKIKISVFIYKDSLLVRRLNYWFKENAKKLLRIHFFKITNGDVVLREDFSDNETSYINEYDANGNILLRMYNKSTVLEMYEYDSNGLIIKMNYFLNSKFNRIFLFEFNAQNDTYSIVETDIFGREIDSHDNVPRQQYMRPRRLAYEIRE